MYRVLKKGIGHEKDVLDLLIVKEKFAQKLRDELTKVGVEDRTAERIANRFALEVLELVRS